MVDALAMKMSVDPVELRMRSFIRPEQFPYETATGWVYDSGDYHKAMKLAMEIAGYDELRREQQEKRRARSWASASPSSPRASAPDRAGTWTSSAWR